MFADIHHMSYRDREAELYRAAARRRQVRLAVEDTRREAEQHEGRREGGSEEDPALRRWSLRRSRRQSAPSAC